MTKYKPGFNYPQDSQADHVREILDSLNSAVPFHCTFIDGIPHENKKTVEAQLEKAFRLWERTWIRPRIKDIGRSIGCIPKF